MAQEEHYFKQYSKEAPDIARLVARKNAAYGDSFHKSGEIIKVLFPDGIPVEKYTEALAIVRVIDKLFRIATQKDAFGENPWKDICGYALLMVATEETNYRNGKV